jgi:hypothetical protein
MIKMDKHIERTYVEEIATQAKYASGALGRMNDCVKALEDREASSDKRQYLFSELFRNIHSFLTHAAVVSKIFWPADRKKAERGEYLRTLFDLEDDHPLMSRSVRNDLDHFDERIDEWALKSKGHNRLDHIIGPRNFVGGFFFEGGDTFRQYIPNEGVFMFRGNEIDIGKIARSLGQLVSSCEKMEKI